MEKQYIDKNAIIEEIERLIKSPILSKSENIETRIAVLEYLLSFIDTIEVKKVNLREIITEADFNEEIRQWLQKHFEVEVYDGKGGGIAMASLVDIAEHFFELGCNTLTRR